MSGERVLEDQRHPLSSVSVSSSQDSLYDFRPSHSHLVQTDSLGPLSIVQAPHDNPPVLAHPQAESGSNSRMYPVNSDGPPLAVAGKLSPLPERLSSAVMDRQTCTSSGLPHKNGEDPGRQLPKFPRHGGRLPDEEQVQSRSGDASTSSYHSAESSSDVPSDWTSSSALEPARKSKGSQPSVGDKVGHDPCSCSHCSCGICSVRFPTPYNGNQADHVLTIYSYKLLLV